MRDSKGVSKGEAAKILGCSLRTVERRIQAGDLETTIIHTRRGPRVRVHLPAPPAVVEATYAVVTTPDDDTATYDTSALVAHVAGPPITPTPEGAEMALLALRALEDMRAERDALRAVVESLRRRRTIWQRIRDRFAGG